MFIGYYWRVLDFWCIKMCDGNLRILVKECDGNTNVRLSSHIRPSASTVHIPPPTLLEIARIRPSYHVFVVPRPYDSK